MSNTLPTIVPLKWSLSHVDLAEERVEPYKLICKEGQTILTNFMIAQPSGTVLGLTYLRKENGIFVTHSLSGMHYTEVNIRWDFQCVAFPFPDE